MSGTCCTTVLGKTVALLGAAALLSWFPATLALASATPTAPCDESNDALKIPDSQLHALNVSHEVDTKSAVTERTDESGKTRSSERYLTSEVDAALREFVESSSDDAEVPAASESDKQPAMKARVPGVSDGDLARYKRHMYRRDI